MSDESYTWDDWISSYYTWDDWLSNYAERAREAELQMEKSQDDVFEFRLTRWGMPDFQKDDSDE